MLFKKSLIIFAAGLTFAPIASTTIMSTHALAEENTEAYSVQQIENDQIATLEKYLGKTEDNSLYFDEQKAREEGISEIEIDFSQQEVKNLNEIAQSENAEITEDFTAIVYPEHDGNTNFRAASGGVTKIVNRFGGRREYYLNAADTQTLINGLEKGNTVATILAPIFSTAASAFTALNTLQLAAIKGAASGGNGIVMIMTPTTDPSLSPTPTISVMSQ